MLISMKKEKLFTQMIRHCRLQLTETHTMHSDEVFYFFPSLIIYFPLEVSNLLLLQRNFFEYDDENMLITFVM